MLKVGFALLSSISDPAPSTRVACLNVFPFLRAIGAEPVVVFDQSYPASEPEMTGVAERAAASGCDVVIFQKIHGDSVLECVARLRALGVATVYCVCDFVDDAMAAAVDRSAAVTEHLRSLYSPSVRDRIDVVPDGIERPDLQKLPSERLARRYPIAAFVTSQELYGLPLIGAPPLPWRANIVGRFPRQRTQRLRSLRWALMRDSSLRTAIATIGSAVHPRVSHTPWSPDGVYDSLLRAEIGIIPVDTSDASAIPEAPGPAWQLKSENRLTLMMALGLPVIATPIPAYEPVIDHGVNGFFARSLLDWARYFEELLDPDARLEIGRKARLSVVDRYSQAVHARLLLDCIRRALNERVRRANDSTAFQVGAVELVRDRTPGSGERASRSSNSLPIGTLVNHQWPMNRDSVQAQPPSSNEHRPRR